MTTRTTDPLEKVRGATVFRKAPSVVQADDAVRHCRTSLPAEVVARQAAMVAVPALAGRVIVLVPSETVRPARCATSVSELPRARSWTRMVGFP
jgi:hypothetical protein